MEARKPVAERDICLPELRRGLRPGGNHRQIHLHQWRYPGDPDEAVSVENNRIASTGSKTFIGFPSGDTGKRLFITDTYGEARGVSGGIWTGQERRWRKNAICFMGKL